MRKIIYTIVVLLYTAMALPAQDCNLVIFAEEGERFQVAINGVIQNEEPQTHVRISELRSNRYKLKILFEEATNGEISKNLELLPGMEYTFNVKRRSKAKDGEVYALRYYSEVPLAQAPPPPPQERVVVYHSTPAPPPPATVIQSTTTTTTTGHPGGFPEDNINFNMNIGVNGVGVNMNSSSTMTETHSTTTTISSSPPPPSHNPQTVYVEDGGACAYPMSGPQFSDAQRSIESKSFEDSKLRIAQQITSANCLLSEQVRHIMMMFDFEATRLDFAKFAYQYTFDVNNYYKVNDAFDFESSIEELDAYIGR